VAIKGIDNFEDEEMEISGDEPEEPDFQTLSQKKKNQYKFNSLSLPAQSARCAPAQVI
jgi:hypothetical protein